MFIEFLWQLKWGSDWYILLFGVKHSVTVLPLRKLISLSETCEYNRNHCCIVLSLAVSFFFILYPSSFSSHMAIPCEHDSCGCSVKSVVCKPYHIHRTWKWQESKDMMGLEGQTWRIWMWQYAARTGSWPQEMSVRKKVPPTPLTSATSQG